MSRLQRGHLDHAHGGEKHEHAMDVQASDGEVETVTQLRRVAALVLHDVCVDGPEEVKGCKCIVIKTATKRYV